MESKIIFETGYFQAPNDIFDSEIELKANEKLVYLYLVRCGNNSTAFPSYNKIGEKCSLSRSTAIRCVKTLTDKGLIKKEYRISEYDDRNLTNIYRIVPPSVRKTPPSSTDTPNKELSNKQISNNKRYIITSNDVCVLEYYAFKYKKKYNKEHPTITKEQLDNVEEFIETMSNEHDIEDEAWIWIIDKYFNDLSPKNNGSVLSFASGDYQQSVIHRYIL